LRRGNQQKAMQAADRVFEHRFRTQQVMHTPLEPLVTVAESTDSTLTIHTASQSPSFVRIEMARLLGWPENRVRVRVPSSAAASVQSSISSSKPSSVFFL